MDNSAIHTPVANPVPRASTFSSLAVLFVATLAACGKVESPPSPAAISIPASEAVALPQRAELPVASAALTLVQPEGKPLSMEEGLALAQKSNCLACHSIDNKVIGPAWMDVSKRYKGVDGIEERLVVKVSTGGYGNWGNMPMPALAPDVKEKDIRALVRFILGLSG